METNQKVQQILQALQMTEQSPNANFPGQIISTPIVTGDERKALVTELVKLLTA